jgi:hypothetical protein
MVNQYYVTHTPRSSFILDIFYEGKLKGQTNHRKVVSQRKLDYKIHKNQRTTSITNFNFQFVHDLAGADHSKATIA